MFLNIGMELVKMMNSGDTKPEDSSYPNKVHYGVIKVITPKHILKQDPLNS